jgi:transcriptional regulator with XRE-family HTH domain
MAGVEQRRAEIAQRIREARRERGLTQEQVAVILGCSRIKMNRVEQAQADLTVIELDLWVTFHFAGATVVPWHTGHGNTPSR